MSCTLHAVQISVPGTGSSGALYSFIHVLKSITRSIPSFGMLIMFKSEKLS